MKINYPLKMHSKFTYLFLALSFFNISLLGPTELLAEEYPQSEQIISDPFEGMNRGIFWFNNQVDQYILEPVAEGYTYVVPKPVRRSVGNFFENLNYPVYLVSDILQLKFKQVGNHTGRFVINTTLGIGGLFDVATGFGFEQHSEDVGAAFGYHGVGTGPYIMLPFLGPSNARDFVGLVADYFLDPVTYIGLDSAASTDLETIGYVATGSELVNTRAELIQAIDTAKDASIDYYSFVKNSYIQSRQGLIYDGFPPEEDDFDEDFDDEEFEEEDFEEEDFEE